MGGSRSTGFGRGTYSARQFWVWNCGSWDTKESGSAWCVPWWDDIVLSWQWWGIGQFTIADSNTVTEADLGVNFFLNEESLGWSRSESCVKLLQELNPDVQGHWDRVCPHKCYWVASKSMILTSSDRATHLKHSSRRITTLSSSTPFLSRKSPYKP